MDKSYLAGGMVMLLGITLAVSGSNMFLFDKIWIVAAMEGLPLLLAAIMLLRCRKSQILADFSAALTGCLWGMGLGVALMAGFLKLIVSGRAHPCDELAYGILILLMLILICTVGLVDALRNRERLSLGRFVWECIIAFSLIWPTLLPAAKLMQYFEAILSLYVV